MEHQVFKMGKLTVSSLCFPGSKKIEVPEPSKFPQERVTAPVFFVPLSLWVALSGPGTPLKGKSDEQLHKDP